MGLDAMILVFWMLSFKPPFSLSSFTFIKRLFSSSLLSIVRLLSSAYLRLWLFLLAILIPACASSSPEFHMMYSACKLNKHSDNIHPCTPFPIWNQSIVPSSVVTVVFWPAYRFFRCQVRWSDILISWRIFQFVVIHTVKGFSVVNETEVDVFLEFSCFSYDPRDVCNLISGSSAFSKSSLNIWNFKFLKRSLVFPILLFSFISLHWSLMKAFLSHFAIFWNSTFRWVYLFLLCL